MAPKKLKKKDSDVTDSGTKLVGSDRKNHKSFKEKLKIVSKSSREASAPGKIEEKDGNAADSVAESVQCDPKNSESSKTKPKDASESSSQVLVQSQVAETGSEVKIENEDNNKKRKKEGKDDINDKRVAEVHHHRNKLKKFVDGKHEERQIREQKSSKKVGGMIFMCNAKTKPDCFHYRVMGVSPSKKDIVMQIKPGLKLFLYDFDLKLMYGIYEASSAGGLKLEPAAFAGGFSAQVRFKIYKDCFPLPESFFKKAIRESYDEKTHKFKTELTVEQVKRLSELFHPTPQLRSDAKSSLSELVPAPIVHPASASTSPSKKTLRQNVHHEQYGKEPRLGSVPIKQDGNHIAEIGAFSPHPLFLTEKEYRSHGLRAERHLLPSTAAAAVGAPTSHKYENYRFDHVREQHQNNASSMSNRAASVQKEPGCPNLLFLSEKEYQAHGLKGCQELPNRHTPSLKTNCSFEDSSKAACNPYDDSTASLVNRYLSIPGPVTTTAEPFYLTGRGAYVNSSSYVSERKHHPVRLDPDRERPHSLYASHSLSDHNRNYGRLGGGPHPTPSTVSSRYSFGGTSSVRR